MSFADAVFLIKEYYSSPAEPYQTFSCSLLHSWLPAVKTDQQAGKTSAVN